jgi:hypothetical protein
MRNYLKRWGFAAAIIMRSKAELPFSPQQNAQGLFLPHILQAHIIN